MKGFRRIEKNGITYALFFQGDIPVEGVQFLTSQTDEFQVGLMERLETDHVKAHQHPALERTVTQTSEFLYVVRGKMHAKVMDEEWALLGEETLENGDFLLFLRGGHEITMLKPTRLIEVKQGPYPGAEKAKIFK